MTLTKGKRGLGLCLFPDPLTQNMEVQDIECGSMVNKSGGIRWRDLILKMNNVSLKGMDLWQVKSLFAQAPSTITLIVLRRHQHESENQHVSVIGEG